MSRTNLYYYLMIKTTTLIAALLLTISLFTSCGSSAESDAKKVAEIQCRAQKLMEKVANGDMNALTESQKISAEAVELEKELEGKYTSEEEKKAFGEALLKEIQNCN